MDGQQTFTLSVMRELYYIDAMGRMQTLKIISETKREYIVSPAIFDTTKLPKRELAVQDEFCDSISKVQERFDYLIFSAIEDHERWLMELLLGVDDPNITVDSLIKMTPQELRDFIAEHCDEADVAEFHAEDEDRRNGIKEMHEAKAAAFEQLNVDLPPYFHALAADHQ